MKNHYEILEIPYTASQQEIQKAHTKLSAKYHPDNNGGVSFFNQVYNQIQEAYNVLSDESRKAEYDQSNNISNTGSTSYNQTEETEHIQHKLNQKPSIKDKKSTSFKTLTFLLTAGFILVIGYFIYESFPADIKETGQGVELEVEDENNKISFDPSNSHEENLRKLLEAENVRDFDVIITFYSGDLERYWNSTDVDNKGLKSQYEKAWRISSYARNNILNIEKISTNILHVTTEFSFTNARTNQTNTSISLNKYVFNNYGLITQVYNIDPEKNYDEYRDNDFSFISNEEKIRRLLRAEDSRNFNKIASFYAPDIERYWNVENIKISDLNKQYDRAWRSTYSSNNSVVDIYEDGYNTYRLRTRFHFSTNENPDQVIISDNVIVFNDEGLITQVYSADSL